MKFKVWDTVRLKNSLLEDYVSKLRLNEEMLFGIWDWIKIDKVEGGCIFIKKYSLWFNEDDFEKMPDGFDVFRWSRRVEFNGAIKKYGVNAYKPNDLRVKVWDKVRLTRLALALNWIGGGMDYVKLLTDWFKVYDISKDWKMIYMNEKTRWTKEQLEIVQEKKIPWLFILLIISLLWNLILEIK